MTHEQRIAEIGEREQKATAEPIKKVRYDNGGGRAYSEVLEGGLVMDCYDEADREFYFNARSDIPFLLKQLDDAANNQDEAWLAVIAKRWMERTGKPWETRDDIEASLTVLFDLIDERDTIAAECLRLMEPERFTLVLAAMFRKETVFFQMAGYDCFPVDALTRTEGKFMVRSTMGNWYECKNLNDLHSQSLDAAKEVR